MTLNLKILTRCPVVTGTTSFFGDEEVLRVKQVGVRTISDVGNDSRFEID